MLMHKYYKQVRRFPELYKRQAQNAIDHAVKDTLNITADSFIIGALIVLIEEFGWGTDEKRATRIPRFMNALQEIIDINADKYDDAVAEGLRIRLHKLGVDFKRG